MSYDDSRAGNATNACAQCLNRVRGDMRIVCLITVCAFLLSLAIAESDVPIGASQYQQRPRILLEPVMKMQPTSEGNPINWFINMVQRVIEPPKKHSPMIGPINLPGMGGHIYIRQKEKTIMPWESPNRVVIKLVSRDPVTGNVMPIDSLPIHPDHSSYHHRPEDHPSYHHRPEDHPSYHHRPEDDSSYHHRQEDHQSYHHRPEDPSRRAAKSYGYAPVNHAPLRPINNLQSTNFVPVSSQSQYSSWQVQRYPRYQQNYVPQYQKPFRAPSPNDYRHDYYNKEFDQGYGKGYHDDYAHRRPNRMSYHNRNHFTPGVAQPMNAVPLPSMYRSVAHKPSNPDPVYTSNEYNDQFKDPQDSEDQGEGYEKPDSLRATQLPYPEYPGLADEELQTLSTTKADNVSHVEHTSASPFRSSFREVIRADRMVPAGGHRNHLRNLSKPRKANHHHGRGSNRGGRSRGFRDSHRFDAKFEARDVGGIEVITAPNLQRGWDDFGPEKRPDDDDPRSRSRESDSGLNLDEDSISMGNGKNLARGESVEHSNEQNDSHDEENFVPVSRKTHSRRASYKVIDRSHRSQGSHRHNNSTENNDSKEISAEIIVGRIKDISTETKSNHEDVSVASTEVEENTTVQNSTSKDGLKVVTVTPSNYRRLQTRRKPRVVKAIYRRKVIPGIIKNSAEFVESSETSEEKSSQESSSEN